MDDFEKRNIALSKEIENLYNAIHKKDRDIADLKDKLDFSEQMVIALKLMHENRNVLKALADTPFSPPKTEGAE